ncbi:MAG: DMT family transporter [Pseudonocardiaceae bacterium]
MTALATGLALLAALLYALASVTQQRSAATVPDQQAGGLRLIRVLIRRPLWWLGVGSDTGGFVAQSAALGFGALLLVQPLLVTTLLFALPLGAWWAGRRMARTDWVWAVLLAVALAVFVVLGDPTQGLTRATLRQWLPAALVLVPLLAGCLLAAVRRGPARAVLLAVATGVAYGVTAALIKAVVSLLDDGLVAVAGAWETYLLAVAALGGTLLQQSAFQAGELSAVLPAVTVGEPLVAAVLGITVLQEQVRADGAEWLLIGVAVAVMVVATVALARASVRGGPEVASSGSLSSGSR